MNEATPSTPQPSSPEESPNLDPEAQKRQRRARWQLNMIIIVTVVPIVLAYLAHYTGFGVPQGRVNEGEILSPAQNLSDLAIKAGELPTFSKDHKWRWFLPVPANCDNTCRNHFYISRQVHIRLANKSERVERYAINVGGESGQAYLDSIAKEHPRLKSVESDLASWKAWLDQTNVPVDLENEHYYLLVDPQGYAMMFYTQAQDGNQLLKDIKRILRHTPEE